MVAVETGRQPSPEFGTEALRSSFPNILAAFLLTAAVAILAAIAAWLVAGVIVAVACAALAVIYVIALSALPPALLMPIYRARMLAAGQGEQISDIAMEIGNARAGLARAPRIYILPSLTLTAFALGNRARSAIALSEGLLRELTMREIAGVIAHETAHILSGDAQLFALSDASARVAQGLGLLGAALGIGNVLGAIFDEPIVPWSAVFVLFVTPALIGLVQLALSHQREFAADLTAARLSGDALGVAAAIRRLTHATGTLLEELTPPAFARRAPVPSLLRAHPEPAQRIERLLSAPRDAGEGFPAIATVEEPMLLHAGFGPAEMRSRYRWPGVWW